MAGAMRSSIDIMRPLDALPHNGDGGAQPGTRGMNGAPADVVLLPWNDIDALEACLERYAGQIAAVIMEPIMGNSGLIPPEPGFLQGVREATLDHDVLLIFDEVITGLRVAAGGASEYYRVTPDITVISKALGGGYPGRRFWRRPLHHGPHHPGRAFPRRRVLRQRHQHGGRRGGAGHRAGRRHRPCTPRCRRWETGWPGACDDVMATPGRAARGAKRRADRVAVPDRREDGEADGVSRRAAGIATSRNTSSCSTPCSGGASTSIPTSLRPCFSRPRTPPPTSTSCWNVSRTGPIVPTALNATRTPPQPPPATLSAEPILEAVEAYRGSILRPGSGAGIGPGPWARGRRSLAAAMVAAGLEPGDRVVMAIGNGPRFVAVLAAILAGGGSPLLLHAETPLEEIKRTAARYAARFAALDALDEGQLRGRDFDPRVVGDDWARMSGPARRAVRPARAAASSCRACRCIRPPARRDKPRSPARPGLCALAEAGALHRHHRHRRPRSAAGGAAHEPRLRLWDGRNGALVERRQLGHHAPLQSAAGARRLRTTASHDLPGRAHDAGDAAVQRRRRTAPRAAC